MEKIENINITRIQLDLDFYPRLNVSEKVVHSYQISMEDGITLPPLVVQKGTHRLIDGWHRYHALKNLGKKKVRVEVLDIPDSELRSEAIRRNIKHGRQLEETEVRSNIVKLRYEDKKSEKEIAETVLLSVSRVSQILSEFEGSRYFNDFNPKYDKVDLRRKVDESMRESILKDLEAGLSGKEIAEKYEVSEATVSNIKKDNKEWKSSPVYFKISPNRAEYLFRVAFLNRLLKKARLEFKEKGVVIRNSDGENLPIVQAIFRDPYFYEYKLSRPIDGYVDLDILSDIVKTKVDFIEAILVDPRTWKLRFENLTKKIDYEERDWREFPIPNLELDPDGIPTTVHVKAKVSHTSFPRNEKGKATFVMERNEMNCSFKCKHGWPCNQTLKMELLEKKASARASVDLETLDQVLKLYKRPVWVGMWSDHSNFAIGLGELDYKICFII